MAAAVISEAAYSAAPNEPPMPGAVFSNSGMVYLSLQFRFKLEASDSGSGVKRLCWQADNGAFRDDEFVPSFDKEGPHEVLYYSEDFVGNRSALKVFPFTLDKTPPEVFPAADNPSVRAGGKLFVTSNTAFHLTALDTWSGVHSISISLDHGETNRYTGAFTLPLASGSHLLDAFAVDNVGNGSPSFPLELIFDNDPPFLQINAVPSPFLKDGVRYIPESAGIVLSASDHLSGVSDLWYSVDGGTAVKWSAPFSLSSGAHRVKAWGSDRLGNTGGEIWYDVTVDAASPESEIGRKVPAIEKAAKLYNLGVSNLCAADYRESIRCFEESDSFLSEAATREVRRLLEEILADTSAPAHNQPAIVLIAKKLVTGGLEKEAVHFLETASLFDPSNTDIRDMLTILKSANMEILPEKK